MRTIGYLFNNENEGKSSKKDLYLFLLDIDQFKKINDELGHVVGDQIILKTAEILKQIAHLHNCFISRYGGDEFIIVCERDNACI